MAKSAADGETIINRRGALRTLGLGAAGAGLLAAGAQARPAGAFGVEPAGRKASSGGMGRPNFLVFFTDQQRWDTLGLHGSTLGLTPNLDHWARRGTFFRQAVTPQPVCGPARSCLQTGQYATTTGVWKNGPGLKPESPKLAEILGAAGYRTAYFGKWHLSGGEALGPVPRADRGGYQDWLGANVVELTSGPYSTVLWDADDQPVRLPGYRVDAQADAMIRWLDAYAGAAPAGERAPFLLFHSFLEPHHQNTDDSYPAPTGYAERLRDAPLPADLRALGGSAPAHWAGYCGMIQRLDEALGRTMDALESLGLAEDTVVVFLSDHGCHFKTRNAEYKRSPHESSVRVPLAFWGGPFNGGGDRPEAASLVDLMPTLLAAAGLPVPAETQGRSLLPLARNDSAGWPEARLIQFGDAWMPPGRALRSARWKYAVTAPDEARGGDSPVYHETHLYDLRADPHELTNLAGCPAHAPVRQRLRERLLAEMAAIGEPSAEILPAPETAGGFGQRKVEYPVFGLDEDWSPNHFRS